MDRTRRTPTRMELGRRARQPSVWAKRSGPLKPKHPRGVRITRSGKICLAFPGDQITRMNFKIVRNVVCAGGLCFALQTALAGGALDTWQLRDSKKGNQPLFDIVYAKGLFAAVGANGTIVTSSDGITWTRQDSGTTNDLGPIIY